MKKNISNNIHDEYLEYLDDMDKYEAEAKRKGISTKDFLLENVGLEGTIVEDLLKAWSLSGKKSKLLTENKEEQVKHSDSKLNKKNFLIEVGQQEHRTAKIPTNKRPPIYLWLFAFIISGFYFLSVLGWIMASYMAYAGILGDQARNFFNDLNIFDHFLRVIQIMLISVASFYLLFMKKIAYDLFKIILAVSIFSFICSFLLGSKWAISFLGSLDSIIILLIVYAYTHFLKRKEFLK